MDVLDLADLLEATLLAHREDWLPRRRLASWIERKIDGQGGGGVDAEIGLLLREVERRSRAASRDYPFRLADGAVLRDGTECLVYEFLLYSSWLRRPNSVRWRQSCNSLFDEVALKALRGYLGRGAKGVQFGFPRPDTEPKNFTAALKKLCQRLRLPQGVGLVTPNVKDGQVDVVVWRPFADQHPAFLSVLAQCTIQRDWYNKVKDVSSDLWTGYVDFGAPPAKALVVPHVMPPGPARADWLKRQTQLVLDRLRLCSLVRVGPRSELRRQLERFLEVERARVEQF